MAFILSSLKCPIDKGTCMLAQVTSIVKGTLTYRIKSVLGSRNASDE